MARLSPFYLRVLLLLTGFLISPSINARGQVEDIRVWQSPERLRVVLDLSDSPKYKAFALKNPDRYVVDFYNLDIKASAPGPARGGGIIRSFRLGEPKQGVSRLVLDMQVKSKVETSYIAAVPGFKPRLAIDFYPLATSSVSLPATQSSPKPAASTKAQSGLPSTNAQTNTGNTKPAKPPEKKDIVIVIDAGHGGEDPGALGRRAREKEVVLQIARRLKKKVDATPGMRGVLTRESDYYIPLRKRIRIAREHKADLFVSIHADAFRKKSARGSSVFALSLKGATSEEAKWLAQKENTADLVGGVALSAYDPDVREVLLDLSMDDTIHQSILFAQEVLTELKKIGRVHSNRVERAGFVVLKSPDIPSVLVETAFITNPHEEKLLRSASHQEKLARAILNGIKRYAKKSNGRVAIKP